jgi:C-terminal processing protease CtpA/Prc
MLHSRVIDYQPDLWAELAYQQRKFFDWGGWLAVRPMDELPHWRVLMRRERIDLRINAGGSFEQALRLPERFLPSGVPLAVYEGREGRALLYATGTSKPRQERLTLVINGQRASSAELFAGILQWHHRAELVGSPTVGKRTVQRVARLDQQHLLFLTTGRFLAPNGSPF